MLIIETYITLTSNVFYSSICCNLFINRATCYKLEIMKIINYKFTFTKYGFGFVNSYINYRFNVIMKVSIAIIPQLCDLPKLSTLQYKK